MPTRTLLVIALLPLAVPAWAQNEPRRPFVAIGAGVQAAARALDDRFEFDQHQEKATVDVDYPSAGGAMFEAGGGLRVWRRLGAGVLVTYSSARSTADVEAAIPHPFHFERPRPISGQSARLERRETGVHLQLRYPLVDGTRLQLTVSAGPSIFNAEQAIVSGVQFDETFPYDDATFRSADTRRASGSAAGFNVGAEVVWPLGRRTGVGAAVRFVRGGVDLDASGRTVSADAGGVQGGAGLRFLF